LPPDIPDKEHFKQMSVTLGVLTNKPLSTGKVFLQFTSSISNNVI